MIITKTNYRISFLGGSSDYPNSIKNLGGVVVGTTISLASYLIINKLPPYHPYKTRLVYNETENINDNAEIKHKVIKACLEANNLNNDGMEILHCSDCPSKTGLGSSSAFTVGLLNGLACLKREYLNPLDLARRAMYIEQTMLKECVGCQDQIWAAYGGLNTIRFYKDGRIGVYPIVIHPSKLEELQARTILFFTGISRNSHEIASSYVPSLTNKIKEQQAMIKLAEEGIEAVYKGDFEKLANLMHNSWMIKRSLGNQITNSEIDSMIATANVYGAKGKITGAGGGGCLLLILKEPKDRVKLETALRPAIPIDFKFSNSGSQVIFSS